MRLIIVGNPNSGKTTIFNHLTGQKQHIGNFPGVTVEYKIGHYGADEIVDLPGLYALSPHSSEEAVAADYIKSRNYDGIINCVDFTNLRRSLALTLSLAELGIPMILVANMVEDCIDFNQSKQLEQRIGIPVFWIKKQNRWAPAVLMRVISLEIKRQNRPPILCRGPIEKKIQWIEQNICFPRLKQSRQQHTKKLDRFLMHPFWGTVFLLGIMAGIFYTTFCRIGPSITEILEQYPQQLLFIAQQIRNPFLKLLIQGAISGIGSVLSFMPTMLLLFFFLAFLEDCGYMVRICYLSQNIMDKLGLSGKSVVPLLLGFGCSVPAVLATRTLDDPRQRKKCLQLIPFFSCSAKLPIYGTLASILAPEHTFVIVFLSYLIGIVAGLVFACFFKNEHIPLILELPPYRVPAARNIWHRMFGQTKAFVQKVFSVLLITSLLTTFLQYCTPQLTYTEDPAVSLLAKIAAFPAPLFKPAKMDHWILISALIAGLFAKESVVSVLWILSPGLKVLSPDSALPFLVFSVLYPPCFATLSVVCKETNTLSHGVKMFFWHLALAYGAAVITAQF